MNRVIPMLPCPSVKEQTAFYEILGFQTMYTTNRPYPYAVVGYGAIEFHFYSNKRTPPEENASMCYVQVDDVDSVYETFTSNLKAATGKLPRSGIPRISKLKHLKEDRRFMLTDLGGNTLYVGTPNTDKQNDSLFYRMLDSEEYAEPFTVLYDLVYSKEDIPSAHRMLAKFFPADPTAIRASELDLAKIWLVALEIQLQQDPQASRRIGDKLAELLEAADQEQADWKKITGQYKEITSGE